MEDVHADRIKLWREKPQAFVREVFLVEPDPWQDEALEAFPHHQQLAMKACKGPGKTCLLAWLAWNFLVTRPKPKVGATSISAENLRDNLIAELAKWMAKSDLISSQFDMAGLRVTHKAHPKDWFLTGRAWPRTADAQRQADTLAGLHADYILFILDESGGIPQSVMATAEAVMASGIESRIVQAGNPTHTDGPLYRACVQDRDRWYVVTITGDPDNPARSSRISVTWARQQIASYGRDNPWVLVNVLGEFPPASINALLGVEDVEAAMARQLPREAYVWAQKRLGVDVARFGDDRTVIFPRQGLVAFKPLVMRHARGSSVSTDIAQAIVRAKDRWGSELEFIDATGGWAAGARDVLNNLNRTPIEVQFHAPAYDPRYKNRRSEIWFSMADWVKRGGCLPKRPVLVRELSVPTYTFTPDGKFLLEPKQQIKDRTGWSPDEADALATTFGLPDEPTKGTVVAVPAQKRHVDKVDFDPWRDEVME